MKFENAIKYTSLPIISMLFLKNMDKKAKKGHRRKSPQGGWGMGSKEPIQKINFIKSGYNII